MKEPVFVIHSPYAGGMGVPLPPLFTMIPCCPFCSLFGFLFLCLPGERCKGFRSFSRLPRPSFPPSPPPELFFFLGKARQFLSHFSDTGSLVWRCYLSSLKFSSASTIPFPIPSHLEPSLHEESLPNPDTSVGQRKEGRVLLFLLFPPGPVNVEGDDVLSLLSSVSLSPFCVSKSSCYSWLPPKFISLPSLAVDFQGLLTSASISFRFKIDLSISLSPCLVILFRSSSFFSIAAPHWGRRRTASGVICLYFPGTPEEEAQLSLQFRSRLFPPFCSFSRLL